MAGLLLWHLGRAGAGAKFTREYADALSEIGCAPSAVLATSGSELEEICAGRARSLPCLPGRGEAVRNPRRLLDWIGPFFLTWAFSRALNELRPEVAVCTFQTIWDVALIPLLRRRGIRYVLVLHDFWFRSGDVYPLRSWSLRRQVQAADGIVVLTDHALTEVMRTFDVERTRLVAIPHPAFVFAKAVALPRKRAGGPLRLLFLGRLIAYKGLDLLLDAYRELRGRGMDVRLEVAGAGDLGPLSAAINDLPEVVLIHRWLDESEMAVSLSRNDVVVLPYREGTQSGIAAAAFAAAVPVVSTPVGGLVEQISRAGAVLSDAVSAKALADAIASLGDDERYNFVSESVLRHAKQDLTWTAAAQRLVDFSSRISSSPQRGLRPARVEATP